MKKNKIVLSMLALLLVLALAGCSKKVDETTPSEPNVSEQPEADTTTENTTEEKATEEDTTVTEESSQDITASISDLEKNDAAPVAFINLAKDQAANASPEELKALAQSVLNAQKKYLEKIIPLYEEANANPEFSDIYALDVTKELADKITDDTIKTLVKDTYENGLLLNKEEGYVYPIIDITIYQEYFFSAMPDAEGTALENEINEYNSSL